MKRLDGSRCAFGSGGFFGDCLGECEVVGSQNRCRVFGNDDAIVRGCHLVTILLAMSFSKWVVAASQALRHMMQGFVPGVIQPFWVLHQAWWSATISCWGVLVVESSLESRLAKKERAESSVFA
jgi:hypothetical protein